MSMNLLAAMTEQEAVGLAFGFMLAIFIVVYVVVGLIIALVIRPVLERVPPAHRQMGPNGPFLLLIPLFSVIWVFFVVLRVSGSLQSYFASVNRTDQGDCGRGIGLGWAICGAVGALFFIPVISQLAGLAGFVLMIVYLVKISGCKNQIPIGG